MLLGLVALVIAANAQIALQTPTTEATPASAEPDKALAVAVAEADPAVAALREGRTQVIGASLVLPDKAAVPPAAPAMEVQIYRYAFADTILARVDLAARSVVSVAVEPIQPVVVLDELLLAKQHLLEDPAVVAALGGDVAGVELIHARLHEQDACAAQRCIGTQFLRWDAGDPLEQEPVPGVFAVFNLAQLRTESVVAEAVA